MDPIEPRTIVIVEDNESFMKILRMRLEAKGHVTVLARDGFEGLNAVRKTKPDLVISDIMLPKLDGHKLCRLIKQDRSVQHIPVIMLTSRDMDEDAEIAKKGGADAFIVKTVHAEIMMGVIAKLLNKNKAA